jgi:hypothetical protein
MHAGSLVLNHRLARSAVFYEHRAAKEAFAFVCVASDRPGGGAKEIPQFGTFGQAMVQTRGSAFFLTPDSKGL